jgi:hypothetical protein
MPWFHGGQTSGGQTGGSRFDWEGLLAQGLGGFLGGLGGAARPSLRQRQLIDDLQGYLDQLQRFAFSGHPNYVRANQLLEQYLVPTDPLNDVVARILYGLPQPNPMESLWRYLRS